MRAQQVVELGKPYSLNDVEKPKPGSQQVLLKTGAAGLCHTDFMVKDDGFGGGKLPLTGSHEAAGTIEELGEGVTDWKVGDRVGAIGTIEICDRCDECKAGRQVFCEKATFIGLGRHGAFADYVVVDSRSCFAVPDGMPFEQVAPVTCAGTTIINAINRAGLNKNDILAISGLGALGHVGIQAAKCLGYRVVGIDVKQDALELAKTLKHPADLLIDGGKSADDALKQIKQTFGERTKGVDAIIVATDAIPAFEFAFKVVKPHGTLIVVGQPSRPIPLNFMDSIFKDVTVCGSLLGSPKDGEQLLKLMKENDFGFTVRKFALEQLGDAVEAAHSATGASSDLRYADRIRQGCYRIQLTIAGEKAN